MRSVSIKGTLTLILSLCWQFPAFAATGLPEEIPQALLDDAKSSYIFVFKDNVQAGEIRGQAKRLATEAGGSLRHVFTKVLKGFSATISTTAAVSIGASPNVAYYEQNKIYWSTDRSRRYEDDDRKHAASPGQGPGRDDDPDDPEPEQVTPWGIERIGGPIDGTGLHAWIIDSGIDLDHPDLNVGYGANFVTLGSDSDPEDFEDAAGHGTHVAGTIAAIDNDIDVVGVAPNATVHSVRVLAKSGFGMTDWIVAGIDFVAANAVPGDCANMSLGGPGHQETMHEAIVDAAELGILFSLAAGNESDDAEDYEPSHIEHANVYTISAIDSNDVFASFSNWGEPVDYAAPGVAVLSTRLGGGVTTMSGTSMAAPHVCGILLHQVPPNIDGYAIDDPDGDPDPIAHQ